MSLTDRMVVITGGAGGIAEVTAPLLLAEGAHLHLIDPEGERLEHVVAKLDAGNRITTAVSDISSAGGLRGGARRGEAADLWPRPSGRCVPAR